MQKSRLPPKISLLREAKIVAMTTTRAAIEHQLLNMLLPQIVVIEEGGGVLEPNLLACLTPNTKHLIMIGDHKQIGPKVGGRGAEDVCVYMWLCMCVCVRARVCVHM